MTEATQQKILKALNQMLGDLSSWLSGLGLSEAEIAPLYSAIIAENGLASKLIVESSLKMVPFSDEFAIKPDQLQQALAFVRSDEFAAWLLGQPEPTDEDLNKMLIASKRSLPNLRQRLGGTAKLGPRYRAGGRSKELPEAEVRNKIREDIKRLREPGVTLKELFIRLARQHQVSPTTIKRIWEEKVPPKNMDTK